MHTCLISRPHDGASLPLKSDLASLDRSFAIHADMQVNCIKKHTPLLAVAAARLRSWPAAAAAPAGIAENTDQE